MGLADGWYIFLISLNENLIEFLSISIVTLFFYFIILRKRINGIFDPFFLSFVFSAMASAMVIYLSVFDLMKKDEYLFEFILTEIAFIIGFLLYKPFNIGASRCNEKIQAINIKFRELIYYTFSFTMVSVQTIGWIKIGIPLLSQGSRLEFYNGGGGVVSIVVSALIPIVIWFMLERYVSEKRTIFSKMYDTFIFIFLFLSLLGTGSKSGFIIVIYIIFFYKLYYWRTASSNKINKLIYCAFICALVVVFIALSIETREQDFFNLLLRLCIRLAGSGDVFAYVYTDDILGFIKTNNVLIDLFAPLFAMFRLIDYTEVNKAIGLQIWNLFAEGNRGPNPRHNIFGVLYFGFYGSIIFSLGLGLISSYVRNKFFYLCRYNLLLYFLYIQLYLCLTRFLTGNFSMAITNFISYILINGFLGIVCYSCYKLLYIKRS